MPRRGGVPRFFDLEVIALNLTVEIKETWAIRTTGSIRNIRNPIRSIIQIESKGFATNFSSFFESKEARGNIFLANG